MEDKPTFLQPKFIQRFLQVFFLILVILLAADFFVAKDHAHFPWETMPWFYPAYGFISCAALVYISKYILRPLVERDEDYYDQ